MPRNISFTAYKDPCLQDLFVSIHLNKPDGRRGEGFGGEDFVQRAKLRRDA